MKFKIQEGRNNKVFLFNKKNKKIIVKKYKKNFLTKYNRFDTERFFLEFLKRKKIYNVPKIICFDQNEMTNYLTFIDGKQIKKVKKKHLISCLKFLKKINFKTTHINFNFQDASDACFSIDDHINTCKIRITKLIKKFKNTNTIKNKKTLFFLENQIIPSFQKINREANSRFSKTVIRKKLDKNNMILSPSDFGFHNIILKKNNLFFIDFEYAGWDDPLKLICDFFLNPDYSISKSDKKYFLDSFSHLFKRKFINIDNFRFVLKFHFLKWVCVILNQVDIEISKKNVNLSYFKKAVNYFNRNKKILE